MKKIVMLFFTLYSSISYSQIGEGQEFCKTSKEGNYFPLVINAKKILWGNTFYSEIKNETKVINGKTYVEFKQQWNNNRSDLLYFREENGVVYQYDSCCENETVRYDSNFEIGHSWKTANGKSEYKILTYNGKLKTPYCEYQNLLVIKAKVDYGAFHFYYSKGHGYIGATQNGKLISCVTPE